MKIVFLPSEMLPFHAETLDERPLGGMETAAIRLSASLQKLGHQVSVFSQSDNPPLSEPLYLPLRTIQRLGPIDALIVVREWMPAFAGVDTKVRLFWTGDSFDLTQNIGIGDKRVSAHLDAVMCVSGWHADTLCAASGYPRDKALVVRNGFYAPYFTGSEQRNRKRLIYSSTPYRGLRYLEPIFVELRKRHPDLELHIFSDYKVYQKANEEFHSQAVAEWNELKARFSKLAGVVLHGNVTQEALAREFMRSGILAYPNTFAETSCITAIEAQAAGCAVVTSARAALPETVADAGVLIQGEPESEEYQRRFVEAVDKIVSDDMVFNKLSAAAKKHAEIYDWDNIASEFAASLQKLIARKNA